MENFRKTILLKIIFISVFTVTQVLFAQEATVESKSSINWITRKLTSELQMDVQKAKIKLPSGKKTASMEITKKMPQLIQTPLLSLYTDATFTFSENVINKELSPDQVYSFIMKGYKSPDIFSNDAKTLKSTSILNIDELGQQLIKHPIAYTHEQPIDFVPSRPYTGIIIDARGSYQVHGEYVSSNINACLFPQIWDDQMNVIYEKNLVEPETVKTQGLVYYHYSDNINNYEDRVGIDPLYIKAHQVFGRNRTDPIIKRKDALKILTVPENLNLLNQGKVVILLDKESLIYDIATPEKNKAYYVNYNSIKQYFYENKVPVNVSDSINGILFSVDLKFYPDSPDLLPSEKIRIEAIAEQLKKLLVDNSYTILVEGHTADVGKPVGQLNLSIERTRTVMNALISEGIEQEIFTYRGYGGTMPIAPNDTEEGRAQNRRVDITARPRATYIQRDWN